MARIRQVEAFAASVFASSAISVLDPYASMPPIFLYSLAKTVSRSAFIA